MQEINKGLAQDKDRQQYLCELQKAKEAAEHASAAKDQFLAVLSHQLRTPLTPVLTAAQMMEADPTLSPRHRELVEMIRRNVELETRLIDDLLDLTRISRGKLTLHRTHIDIHESIARVMTICGGDIRSKRLCLVQELGASQHHVHADAARIQQVLWNLLKNAVKFTSPGGTITVSTNNPQANRLCLSVADTGIGIDIESLPHIFDAFKQGGRDITRQFGGLGMGLAISKSVVDLHGGFLMARSDGRGKGAIFTAELPTCKPVRKSDSSSGVGNQESVIISGRRILLVEDHVDTSRIMAMVLRTHGHEVRVANGVGSALRVAEAEHFDLLLSDIGLPDGSGLDLIRQLLQRRPIKAIALSGYGMEEDVRKSKEAGFAFHLTKPVDITKLDEIIRELTA